jgi:hypothetical protein
MDAVKPLTYKNVVRIITNNKYTQSHIRNTMNCTYCSKPGATVHADGVADGEGAACNACHTTYWHETPTGDATLRSMELELALYPCSEE